MWKWRLEATARRANPIASTTAIGWGMINPYAAVTIAANAHVDGPINPMTGTSGNDTPPVLPVTERSSGAEARTRADLTIAGIAFACVTFLGCLVVVSWLRKPGRGR